MKVEGEDTKCGESTDENISDDDPERPSCPICLIAFTTQDIGTPESCDHDFCLSCIQEWSNNVNTCPFDRQVFHIIFARHRVGGEIHEKISVTDRALDNEEEDEEPTFCEVCRLSSGEERLLLCDGCDNGYHLECLNPPLAAVPIEEWYCPECQHPQPHVALTADVPANRVRGIPRTLGNRRIYQRVQQIFSDTSSSSDEEDELGLFRADVYMSNSDDDSNLLFLANGDEPSTSASLKKSPVKRKRIVKRKPAKRRKTRKSTSSGKKKSGRRKNRRKQTWWKKKSAKGNPTSVKRRLADRLGLCAPPTGCKLPRVRSKKPATEMEGLSMFGDYFLNTSSVVLDKKQPAKVTRSENSSPLCSSTDLLGSILDGQSLLGTRAKHIEIKRDGTLMRRSVSTSEISSLPHNNVKSPIKASSTINLLTAKPPSSVEETPTEGISNTSASLQKNLSTEIISPAGSSYATSTSKQHADKSKNTMDNRQRAPSCNGIKPSGVLFPNGEEDTHLVEICKHNKHTRLPTSGWKAGLYKECNSSSSLSDDIPELIKPSGPSLAPVTITAMPVMMKNVKKEGRKKYDSRDRPKVKESENVGVSDQGSDVEVLTPPAVSPEEVIELSTDSEDEWRFKKRKERKEEKRKGKASRDRSRSPRRDFTRSPSPRYRSNWSPDRRYTRSPNRKYTRSPHRSPNRRGRISPYQRSRSPRWKRSKSPFRRRSPRRTGSPARRISRSPRHRESRSPRRRGTRSPTRRKSKSPYRRRNRSPFQKRSKSPGSRRKRPVSSRLGPSPSPTNQSNELQRLRIAARLRDMAMDNSSDHDHNEHSKGQPPRRRISQEGWNSDDDVRSVRSFSADMSLPAGLEVKRKTSKKKNTPARSSSESRPSSRKSKSRKQKRKLKKSNRSRSSSRSRPRSRPRSRSRSRSQISDDLPASDLRNKLNKRKHSEGSEKSTEKKKKRKNDKSPEKKRKKEKKKRKHQHDDSVSESESLKTSSSKSHTYQMKVSSKSHTDQVKVSPRSHTDQVKVSPRSHTDQVKVPEVFTETTDDSNAKKIEDVTAAYSPDHPTSVPPDQQLDVSPIEELNGENPICVTGVATDVFEKHPDQVSEPVVETEVNEEILAVSAEEEPKPTIEEGISKKVDDDEPYDPAEGLGILSEEETDEDLEKKAEEQALQVIELLKNEVAEPDVAPPPPPPAALIQKPLVIDWLVQKVSGNNSATVSPTPGICSAEASISQTSQEDDEPLTSATELTNNQLLNKMVSQERIADEVKIVLKPYYTRGSIDKDDYKFIMKNCVTKIYQKSQGRVNPAKVKVFVEKYVQTTLARKRGAK